MALLRWAAAFIIIFLLPLAGSAIADPLSAQAVRFGPEFTFSSFRLLLGSNGVARWKDVDTTALNKYGVWLREYCREHDCVIEMKFDSKKTPNLATEVRVLFVDGTHFSAKTDANVIEFSVSPLSASEWKSRAPFFQELIFDGMKKVGLKPTRLYGSGHINIDKETAFGNDLLRYRDFIVDFYNHPGLSEGILESDPFNARGLAQLGKKERANFSALIDSVDRGEVKTIKEFEKLMREKVMKGNKFQKGYALYFHAKSIEISAVRAQKSARQFAKYAELFERRIHYLKELRQSGLPVKVLRDVGTNSGWHSMSQFFYYLNDLGLSMKDFGVEITPKIYKRYPNPLPRDAAFSRRNGCVYWLKGQKTSLFDWVGTVMGGIGK